VEVRSREEILRSLDERGRLQGLPFMPQMLQYCGQRFRVYKRAHKTCDTVNPTQGRRLASGIHLQLRCDGKAYGGCQAGCLLFWKEAWLKQIDKEQNMADSSSKHEPRRNGALSNGFHCSEADVWKATRVEDQQPTGEIRYVCQATELPYFTTPLRWWDPRQYLEDYISRNVTLSRMLCTFVYAGYYEFARRRKLGAPFRWLYDRFQALWGGVPFPRKTGKVPVGERTPTSNLNLLSGELVRVRSYDEIRRTLDSNNKNRGLFFDAELVPYCGGTYRVNTRVTNFINEKTGKMSALRTPAVILENVYCQSRYSDCRAFCPRSIYPWWREVWLERVSENGGNGLSEG
jgi:hypothetical protein